MKKLKKAKLYREIMGNKQGSLGNHLDTASKTGALAFPGKKLEEFPEDLSKVAQTLRNLDLSNNRITGLPSSIGNFKALKTLNLSGNRITQLPPQIGQLTKLETLILNGNLILDLPDTIANLKNLKELNLSGNRIQRFPLALTKLRKLDVVDLSSNNLTNIPDEEIHELQVTELNLNQNQLSRLSANIAKCPRLKTLRLDENCLALEALPVAILTDSVISTLSTNGNLFTEKQLAEVEGYSAYLERYTAVKRKMD